MNIYHTRSKIKSKRHQPTKNRETSALQLRKISWLITKKKKHSKILHKSQMAYKRRSLHLHFPTAFSSRSIWQREHSRQNIKVRASLHREPWKKKVAVNKLQLLPSKVLGRLLLFTFLFPPPAPGPILSKTSMFVRVIALLYPNN